MIEPGGIRTGMGTRAVFPDPLPAYAGTPADNIRKVASQDLPAMSDPVKVARRIIEVAEADHAPRRVVLGSDAYLTIRGALAARLAEIDAQKDTAGLTDADDVHPEQRKFL